MRYLIILMIIILLIIDNLQYITTSIERKRIAMNAHKVPKGCGDSLRAKRLQDGKPFALDGVQ